VSAFDIPVEQSGVQSADGPLLVLDGVVDVGWDEYVEVVLASGEVRHGVVLEVDRGLAVVEVFEGTSGIAPPETRVRFSGAPLRIPVTDAWLGRVCNGRGEPVDGGPPVLADELRDVVGRPIDPALRATPRDPIVTGISAIDALTTLVRGQKLPVFSVGGLPHLELAARIAALARVEDESFCVVFAAMGLTHADAAMVVDVLDARTAEGRLGLFLNTAADPVMERFLTPRLALTVAEHLAFDLGNHVLVVMADMTSYCEALREVSAARGEVPGRRGYPAYLYSDLASLYERCGRIRDRLGSITQVPVLTMPAGDITHPVPDLTGYITEGQIVLSPEMYARGIDPPIDPLASLSRLMRLGAGPGRTRDDHLRISAQLFASLAQARQAREIADLVGASALSDADQHLLDFADTLERRLLSQPPGSARSLDETLDIAWAVAGTLPRSQLTMIDDATLDRRYPGAVRTS
jgi:V/A-type H+-transporting ATPase subunit B